LGGGELTGGGKAKESFREVEGIIETAALILKKKTKKDHSFKTAKPEGLRP